MKPSIVSSVPRHAGALLAGLLALAPWMQAQAQRPLDPALAPYAPQPVRIDPGAAYVTADGALRIAGAEHVRFIVERFNLLFAHTHPGVRFALEGKGTTSAVPLLTFGRTLFGPMGRAINPIELVPYRKVVGQAPLELAVAHTSDDPSGGLATTLAVYVNRANPLARLSTTQLSQVLSSGNPEGDYSTWGQLGLGGAWQKRAIHPYGTPSYTGFGDYLQQTYLHQRALASAYEEAANSETILQRVGADPAGIGVAAIGLDDAHVRQVALVGADAADTRGSATEVAAHAYPLGRSLYFYLRKAPGQPLDPVVREYLRLVLSREGQAIVAAQPNGYIPLTAVQAQAQLRKLDLAD